jgi:exodeoxyribonuclease VII small subunit
MTELAMSETKQDGERFEDQLENLEKIVARLEDESVGLEEALGLFEDGMELARSCRARLEEVEQRVTQLLEDDANEPDIEEEEENSE